MGIQQWQVSDEVKSTSKASYANETLLFGDQANQIEGASYLVTYQGLTFPVIKKATSTASITDYTGFPIYLEKEQNSGDNTTLVFNKSKKTRTITAIEVFADPVPASVVNITVEIDGVQIASGTIAAGNVTSTDMNITNSTWTEYKDLHVIIPNSGSTITASVSSRNDGVDQSPPLPQLSTPTMNQVQVDSATELTFSWNDPNTSPNESGVDFIWSTTSDFSANVTTVNKAADATSHQLTGLTEGVPIYGKTIAKGDGLTVDDSLESIVVNGTPVGTVYIVDDDWSATPTLNSMPDGWSVYNNSIDASNYMLYEAGLGFRLVAPAGGTTTIIRDGGGDVFTIGVEYTVEVTVVDVTSGSTGIEQANFSTIQSYNSVQTYSTNWTADRTILVYKRGATPANVVVSRIRIWET